jgi:hypothetical protein
MNYSEPCENSWYLREQEYKDDIANQHWLDSLPEKYESILDYCILILKGEVCSTEYDWVFNEYSSDTVEYERLICVTEDWLNDEVSQEDEEFLFNVVQAALEGASEILYDVELSEIITEGNFSLSKMISEVIG